MALSTIYKPIQIVMQTTMFLRNDTCWTNGSSHQVKVLLANTEELLACSVATRSYSRSVALPGAERLLRVQTSLIWLHLTQMRMTTTNCQISIYATRQG